MFAGKRPPCDVAPSFSGQSDRRGDKTLGAL
jgi:hypothetical protein